METTNQGPVEGYLTGEWSNEDVLFLRRWYPHMSTGKLAEILRRPVYSVYRKAQYEGIGKSETFFKSELSGRLDGAVDGVETRFKDGHPYIPRKR